MQQKALGDDINREECSLFEYEDTLSKAAAVQSKLELEKEKYRIKKEEENEIK